MVNYGRSRACLTCKKRRVKCDQAKPNCLRCLKIGKSCPGYIDDWNLAFRDENHVVSSKLHGTLSRPSSPAAALSSDLESWVIKAFCRDYVVEACDAFIGFLAFLPEMYEQASHDSILRLSMCAAAYANFASRAARKDVEILAIAAYNKALNMATFVLTNCTIVPRETTMTAIFLLGLYENITSRVVESPRQYHSNALIAMADLRGDLLRKGNGPGLLEIVCCQMQRRKLDLEQGPTATDLRLFALLDTSLPQSHMLLYCCEVGKFIAETKTYLSQEVPSSKWYTKLHLEVQELEQRFRKWDGEAAAALERSISSTKGFSDPVSAAKEPTFNTFAPFITCLWNKIRATRMLLHHHFIQALSRGTREDLPYELEDSQVIIRTLSDDIMYSLPSALNFGKSLWGPSAPRSLGGYLMIWPLQVILRSLHASESQRIQARKSLEKTGLDCGLSYAVTYARSSELESELDSASDLRVHGHTLPATEKHNVVE